MRHIVYLLLLANLVYLGWNLFPGNSASDPFTALPPVPEGAKPLVTLKEMQRQSAVSTESGAFETLNSTEPPGAGILACKALGPFEIEAEVKAVAERLDKLGLQPRQRIAEVREENGFWVYLPSMDRADALEITRKLDESGDSDYYVGRDNFISLGAFKDISRAEVRLGEVRKLGLDAILEARFSTHDTYWLEFRTQPSADRELSAILEKNTQLQLHELECL